MEPPHSFLIYKLAAPIYSPTNSAQILPFLHILTNTFCLLSFLMIAILSWYLIVVLAQRLKRLPAVWETWVQSLGLEDPLEKEMAPTPVFLPGEFHGQRSLVGYSPWGRKESDTTERLHFLSCT